MMQDTRRRDLVDVVRAPPLVGGLTEACLLIARGEYPDLSVDHFLAETARLSARVRSKLDTEGGRPWRVLQGVLAHEEDFAGDEADYGHPDNSYLNRVFERRRGLPILLAVVWIEVARGARVPAEGVGLPGHFIARVGEGDETMFVDPFHRGQPMSRAEALRVGVAATHGQPADPAWLEPVAPRAIVARVLNNLVETYDRRGEPERMERVLSDQLALRPGDGRLLVRRGDVRSQIGDADGALLDLNEALLRLEDGPLFRHAHELASRLARLRTSWN